MKPICIEELISIRDLCQPVVNSHCGGAIFDVSDIVGFTWSKSASINDNETTNNVTEYMTKVRRNASIMLYSELLNDIRLMGIGTSEMSDFYNTDKEQKDKTINALNSGLWIGKMKKNCILEKMYIHKVCVRVCYDGMVKVQIRDSAGYIHLFDVDVEDGITKCINVCDGNGNPIRIYGGEATITIIDPSPIKVYSIEPMCGCGTKNPYIDIRGFNNGNKVNIESYGVSADITAGCSYDIIFCNYNKELLAQIMLAKMAVLFYIDSKTTTNNNYYTLYSQAQDEGNENRFGLSFYTKEYERLKNMYTSGLFDYLINNTDGVCLTCKIGSTIKTIV